MGWAYGVASSQIPNGSPTPQAIRPTGLTCRQSEDRIIHAANTAMPTRAPAITTRVPGARTPVPSPKPAGEALSSPGRPARSGCWVPTPEAKP